MTCLVCNACEQVAQLLDLYKESSVRVVQPTTDELVEEKDVRKACLAVAKSLQKVANQACSPEDVLVSMSIYI